MSLPGIIREAYNWIVGTMERLMTNYRSSQEDIKVCLVGHSRGATAAIALANRLSEPAIRIAVSRTLRAPIRVHFVGLYDTVNRSTVSIDPDMRNVRQAFHARRRNISTDPERGSRGSFGVVEVPQALREEFDTSHGGVGGNPGFFTPLDARFADLYCNAWTFLLTQEQIDQMFGTGLFGGHKYTPLAGDAWVQRKAALRRFWVESQRADQFVRNGAAGAGLILNSATTWHPYGDEQERWWRQLHAILASEN
jgi:hypothetical protein